MRFYFQADDHLRPRRQLTAADHQQPANKERNYIPIPYAAKTIFLNFAKSDLMNEEVFAKIFFEPKHTL
jgi:hypothetical protein